MNTPTAVIAAAIAAALAIAGGDDARANGRTSASVDVRSSGDLVLLAATFGLLISRDGGASFEWICESNIGYGGVFDPDYAIAADGALWATTSDGVRVSRDGGCAWQTAGGALAGRFFEDVEIGGDGRIWVASATGGDEDNDLFVSSDGGATFEAVGLAGRTFWRSLRVAPSDPARIYAAGFLPPQPDGAGGMEPAQALLRVSSDGGQSWDVLDASATTFAFGTQPSLFVEGVHPTNPNILFARVFAARQPSGDDLYRSDNGGQTWTRVLEMRDKIVAFAIRSDGQTVITGTVGNCTDDPETAVKGCVRISTDGGLTFAAAATEPQMACVHERQGGELLACGANGEPDNFALGRSIDGQRWEKLFQIAEIAGPVSCPESEPQRECAALDWPNLCRQLGACPDADVADEVEPPKDNCLGCSAAGLSLGLVLLLPWARVRRPN